MLHLRYIHENRKTLFLLIVAIQQGRASSIDRNHAKGEEIPLKSPSLENIALNGGEQEDNRPPLPLACPNRAQMLCQCFLLFSELQWNLFSKNLCDECLENTLCKCIPVYATSA